MVSRQIMGDVYMEKIKKDNGLMPEEEIASIDLKKIEQQVKDVMTEFIAGAGLMPGDLIVIGCSSSEVIGHKIGTYSSEDVAETIVNALYPMIINSGFRLAAQCCEHLNRALIIEQETLEQYRLDRVNVVPMPKAGGSFATKVYAKMRQPVAVEEVKAAGGIDIGDTLIGMHLRPVAVPLRIQTKQIGSAHVVCARTRYKFIGGSRAHYEESLL